MKKIIGIYGKDGDTGLVIIRKDIESVIGVLPNKDPGKEKQDVTKRLKELIEDGFSAKDVKFYATAKSKVDGKSIIVEDHDLVKVTYKNDDGDNEVLYIIVDMAYTK